MMKQSFLMLFTMVVLLGTTLGQSTQDKLPAEQPLDCKLCHTCENPTKKDPCLKECPRSHLITVVHSPEEGPEVLIMDELSEIYVPVVFSHKLHAQMSLYSGECSICHHRNPPGPILGCKECHEASAKRSDLSKVGLKGAYHRQCMGCHREWSHTTECAVCHALKSAEVPEIASIDSIDIVGTSHPSIPEPTKVVYETESEEGKIVTFYHDQHIKPFGFKCVNCHIQESCSKCHDIEKTPLAQQASGGKPIKVHKTVEEHHLACSLCHNTEKSCKSCHLDKPMGPFNHAVSAKWALNHYHKSLSCQRCHGKKNKFTKLNKECDACHGSWNSESFNHKITGLVLDENHIENECEDCHIDRKFAKQPTCDNCHDEITYPKNTPGKFLRAKHQ